MEQGNLESLTTTNLPTIDTPTIASTLSESSECVQATLFIMDGQYAVRYRERDGRGFTRWTTKFISPTAVNNAFTAIPVDSGYLPNGTVRWGAGKDGIWLATFMAPRCTPISLWINTAPRQIVVPLPHLVFLGMGMTYWVWAVKEKRFSPCAKAYHVPLPNVYPDGTICYGENRPPVCGASTIEQAFSLFIDSPFNEHLVSGKSRIKSQDIRDRLLALNGKPRYPLRDLVPVTRYYRDDQHATVGELIDAKVKEERWI